MSDTGSARLWMYRAGFTALAMGILFSHLLPLQTLPRSWGGPDVLLLLGLCWSVRRPEVAPLWLLAGMFLLADFLLQRPPGLWAALSLFACNEMQHRASRLRAGVFGGEWARAALVIIAITLAWRVILAALMVPLPGLGPSLIQMLFTILAYPLVFALSLLLPGLRTGPSGELDGRGFRT